MTPDGEAPPHTVDVVPFDVAGVTLAGLLQLPQGNGWYPAVVLIGDTAQSVASRLPDFLVGLGYAVLTFDEQGTGLAPAALAAADSLLMRPDIRADLIGLLGLSEGAWVAAFAAARVPETAFAVLLPGDTPLPADLSRLVDVHCPVLAFAPRPVTAEALARHLAHNQDAEVHSAEVALFETLGPWLVRQAG